ncbi:hypothetical protein F5J12DRAFT_783659 [Pisolithus orientalis]|uniref:uncharacterized protein n=1 Tax=Pisolithus orientalis TaxID=936130 RepID=UPI0022245AFD|nr:uncharacterized protein F5J12DRAFT_783659 [Pisolithus orientalis]KAI6003227.1 hypothetical protein F5J12DRAFT_783659 [Pisolithus orientalis]
MEQSDSGGHKIQNSPKPLQSLRGRHCAPKRWGWLTGRFKVDHILEEIVARFGEATVLAWSGKLSSYNSYPPASISVYNQTLRNFKGKKWKRASRNFAESCPSRKPRASIV